MTPIRRIHWLHKLISLLLLLENSFLQRRHLIIDPLQLLLFLHHLSIEYIKSNTRLGLLLLQIHLLRFISYSYNIFIPTEASIVPLMYPTFHHNRGYVIICFGVNECLISIYWSIHRIANSTTMHFSLEFCRWRISNGSLLLREEYILRVALTWNIIAIAWNRLLRLSIGVA